MNPLHPPPVVLDVAAAVRDAGGRALLVGGSVRDHLMGQPVKDWDIEVHGLDLDALEAALRRVGRVNTVGKAFAVLKLKRHGEELDISIPRRDSKQGRGHKGIVAEGDPHLGVHEATRRRDLTINAILLDLHDHTVIDPFDGQADLAAGRLRAVDRDTFLEDPLRALRAVQFCARFGFVPEPSLVELCREARLDELPPERIQTEWVKLLLRGAPPSLGLAFARQADLLARVFPALPDDPAHDVALDRAAAWRDRHEPEGRTLAALLVGWLAPSPAAAASVLDALMFHTWRNYPLRDRVLAALDALHAPVDTDTALRRLATRAEPALVLTGRHALGEDVDGPWQRAVALDVLHDRPAPLAQGRDLVALGVRPGPRMGELLQRAYEAQLDGVLTTPEQARSALADWLHDAG